MIVSSPKWDSLIKSNVEEIVDLDVFVKTFHVDTTTNQGDQSKVSTTKKTTIIPPGISNVESVTEEVRTSSIPVNMSNMDINVSMGEGVLTTEPQGKPIIVISSTFDTSTISSNLSLPPFVSTVSTTLPPTTYSPTFDQILQQPITSLFPYQSTYPRTVNDDATTNNGEFTSTFGDLEFDQEEENISNHMRMQGVVRVVYVMFKFQEHRLRDELEHIDRHNENRVKAQSSSFNLKLKELKDVEKEKHLLYVQVVKKVREDVNLKLENLRVDMAKEVAAISHDFSTLYTKVDIIAFAVVNFFKWYKSLIPKVDKIAEIDLQNFSKVEDFLHNLKDLVSKIGLSSSLLTPESLAQRFDALESTLKAELAQLANLMNLIPTNASPVQTG
ncbi:unnamed protein product [Lactuca saligna]|uniref:Uncharacterized protein n=1 Tax=Lactuca saligna TaxID=75948 RepID=A0AA36E4K4_LACSI|nr:unnamed protein product [Lactuca saligna]